MADSYSFVKGGKLKLKGKKDKSHKKHKKHKKREREEEEDTECTEDSLRHGGWWIVEEFSYITGPVAIEVSPMVYVQAKDNGTFSVGESRDAGEGPSPEEILMAIRVNDTKVALKSGFDKYLSVKSDGLVIGRSDAIGSREQWEPVFQDGKLALMGCNNCFLLADPGGAIVCSSRTAEENNIITMRSCAKKEKKLKSDQPVEERSTTRDTELHYVKQFQSFQDRHIRVNPEARMAVRDARKDGNLHEVLLDRREKMKSDRYCK